MPICSSFRHFELTGWSNVTSLAPALKYDVAILFAGWELRSAEIDRLPAQITRSIIVSWEEAEKEPDHTQCIERLCAYATRVTGLPAQMLGFPAMRDFGATISKLADLLSVESARLGRPLHVLMDISNCPEIITMALLAWSVTDGTVAQWTTFYAEAVYGADASGRMEFTRGEWNVLPVPGLHGINNPASHTALVLGLGFEGLKARQIITQLQPDCVCLLLPDPGFIPDYTKKAAEENKHVLAMIRGSIEAAEVFAKSELGDSRLGRRFVCDRIISAPAGDLVTTLNVLAEATAHFPPNANVLMVPTGPKPHAIAMALLAASVERWTALYRNPERYVIRPSAANGQSWITTIRDRAAVLSASQRAELHATQSAWLRE